MVCLQVPMTAIAVSSDRLPLSREERETRGARVRREGGRRPLLRGGARALRRRRSAQQRVSSEVEVPRGGDSLLDSPKD